MGVERAVTRWYAHFHTLHEELTSLQASLAQKQAEEQTLEERALLERQIDEVYARLTRLGPCPKSMMG